MNSERNQFIRTIITALAIGGVGFLVAATLLSPFFSGKIILPQSVSLFGFKIQLYGLAIALAALAGYWLAIKRRERFGILENKADAIIFVALVGGFVGARLYHVVSEFSFYMANPLQSFAVWNGGLSIYGAGLGGFLAVYVHGRYQKESKINFLSVLDWLVPSVVLGQIIGRFGNFVNYELYGSVTNLPWKMFVPQQFRIPPFEMNQFFHPLFLYEAAGSLVILVILLRLKFRTGYLFLTWVFLYNVMRFFLEFLRVDSVIYSGIRINAVVSLLLASLAIFIWYKLKSKENAV